MSHSTGLARGRGFTTVLHRAVRAADERAKQWRTVADTGAFTGARQASSRDADLRSSVQVRLSFFWSMREWLGPDHSVVKAVLGSPVLMSARGSSAGRSWRTPKGRLARLGGPESRCEFRPMIQLARHDADAHSGRSSRRKWTAPRPRDSSPKALKGVHCNLIPTPFTLRVTYGDVEGWMGARRTGRSGQPGADAAHDGSTAVRCRS
jgi:hypothetical protein